MKIYTSVLICDVCGCRGVATPKTETESWFKDSFISHRDPQVCAENLKRKKKIN